MLTYPPYFSKPMFINSNFYTVFRFAIKRHTIILSRLDNETTFKFNSLYLASIDTINATIRVTCGVRIFRANQTMKLCNCTRIHGNVVCHCNHSNTNTSTYNGTLEKVFINSSSKDENTNLHGNRHQGPLTRDLSHGNKVSVLNIANSNKESNHGMGSVHLTVSVTNGEIKHVTKRYGSHGNTSHGDKRQFQNIKILEKRRDNSSFDDSSHRNSSYGNATVSSNATTAKMVSGSANTSYMLLNSTLNRNRTNCICMHIVPVNSNLTEWNSMINTTRAKSEYNQNNTVHETSSRNQIENGNKTGKKMANKISTQNDVENENCSRNNIARNVSVNSNKLCNETIDQEDYGNISTNNVTNINVTWYNSSVYSYHNKTTNCTCYEIFHESNHEEPPPPQCIPPKWEEEFVVYMAESNWRLIFHDHLVHHVKADGKYDMNLTVNESMLGKYGHVLISKAMKTPL